jgi:hypothetical protein
MRFCDFEKEAIRRIGHSHGWKKMFAEQAGYPDCVILQRWKKADAVPHEAVTFLPKLIAGYKSERHKWTLIQYRLLFSLYAKNTPDTTIRDILRAEFGLTITLGGVKRAKSNLRRGIVCEGVHLERPVKQRQRRCQRIKDANMLKTATNQPFQHINLDVPAASENSAEIALWKTMNKVYALLDG